MTTRQHGFTLIELVMVIVILGILAAVAVPKFVDLSGSAKQAKADGVAGAIAASGAIQYAANAVSSTFGYSSVSACAGSYLTSGSPTGCTLSGGGTCTSGAATCSVSCDGYAATGTVKVPC